MLPTSHKSQQSETQYINFFLISVINSDLTKSPLFVTDDQTFGINFFNQWKKTNGLEDTLCQILPIEFIPSELFKNTDIQTTQIGDINDN